MIDSTQNQKDRRASVQQLSASVSAIDAAILDARREIGEIEQRREPLKLRLTDLANAAADEVLPDQAVIDALVADPTADPDVEAITAAVSAARKATDIRAMQAHVVSQAIDQIGQEIAAVEARVVDLHAQRRKAWHEFADAAHNYLLRGFLQEFQRLVRDYYRPAYALEGEQEHMENGVRLSLVKHNFGRLPKGTFEYLDGMTFVDLLDCGLPHKPAELIAIFRNSLVDGSSERKASRS